jgi:endoglucanase
MTDLLPFLKSLLSVSGLSAYEAPAARLIKQRWAPLVDEIDFSRLGSIHALKQGSGKPPRRSVLMTAHMDSIGLIAKKIVDGFIYVASMGEVDVRVLPGIPVLVHARSGGLPGVVAMPNAKLLPETQHNRYPDLSYLVVDTGLTPAQVSKRVQVGDLISFDTAPLELSGEMLSGHSLDNRASIAALTVALEELRSKFPLWDVWAVATTQEEVSYAGAATSAFHLQPDLAIAVDVTFGRGPGASGWDSFPIGGGPTLGIGPNIHPSLHKHFKELAQKLEIPYAVEPMPGSSSTDAEAMQVARQGIPTMVLGIPLRYMHTPVEAVLLKDIRRAGRLLAEFALSLEADFIEKIVWK